MTVTEINWGYNCLTSGIHHGRPEAIWNIALMQTIHLFKPEELKQLVVDRIYNDAMLMVEHGDEPRMAKEWADKTKEHAEHLFAREYQHKIGEISHYYRSEEWRTDIQNIIERNKQGTLNTHYQPLHGHDSINMLCRILGTRCSRRAATDLTT